MNALRRASPTSDATEMCFEVARAWKIGARAWFCAIDSAREGSGKAGAVAPLAEVWEGEMGLS